MSVKNDFNELVRKWLEVRLGHRIVKAEIGDYTDAYTEGGCPTCGGGIEKEFDIKYWTVERKLYHAYTVFEDPLSWLADTLLPFADEVGL